MKRSDEKIYLCPVCRGGLAIEGAGLSEGNKELLEGGLICRSCDLKYPVVQSIPRFVSSENYAANFGFQWQKFQGTQINSEAFQKINKERFYATTQWPKQLQGQKILEAGCGAGRFTMIALETGAELYSFDLSEAVNVCLKTRERSPFKENHHLSQASIYNIPLPYGMFDKIFCMGVLQHCPDVKKVFFSLIPLLKPGGEIVVDCYLSRPLKHAFSLKYWLRPFFFWWNSQALLAFLSFVISIICNIKVTVARIPWMGKKIADCVPPKKLKDEPEGAFSLQEMKEIKTLAIYDMLSPRYDQCQSMETFDRWIHEAGLIKLEVSKGYNGVNVRAQRPQEG